MGITLKRYFIYAWINLLITLYYSIKENLLKFKICICKNKSITNKI